MRRRLRGASFICRIAYSASRTKARSLLFLVPALGVVQVLIAIWLRVIVQAALADDQQRIVVNVLALSAMIGISALAGWAAFITRVDLQQRSHLVLLRRICSFLDRRTNITFLDAGASQQLDRLRDDAARLSYAYYILLEGLAQSLRFVLILLALGATHLSLLLIPLAAVVPASIALLAERSRRRVIDVTRQQVKRAMHAFDLCTSASTAREIRLYGLQREIISRQSRHWNEVSTAHRRADVRRNLSIAGGWAVFGCFVFALLLSLSSNDVLAEAAPGDVLLILVLTAQLPESISGTASVLNAAGSSLASATRFLDTEAGGLDEEFSGAGHSSVLEVKEIVFDKVSFVYPNEGQPTLQNLNLTLHSGDVVAVVGRNGAGKSTLVRLLCGLYPVTEGRIRINGVPLAEMNADQWRSKISVAFQDHVRYQLPLREAVGIGDGGDVRDVQRVWSALASIGADEWAATLSKGIDTQLGSLFEGGVNLSGGQWQQVAIARSAIRERPLVRVLDEPTAQLDAKASREILVSVASGMRDQGTITLVVAHNLELIRSADYILFLEPGRPVEIGRHDELIVSNESYRRLISSRLSPDERSQHFLTAPRSRA